MRTQQFDRTHWINYLLVKKLSERTITEYNRYLDKFMSYDLTQQSVLQFMMEHNNCVARAFVQNLLFYIRTNNIANVSDIVLPRVTGRKKRTIPNVLSLKEIHAIAEACRSERTALMVFITFYGGLRESELVGQYFIRPYSFQWNTWLTDMAKQGTLKLTGKGGKQRRVYLPPWLMYRIQNWIKAEIAPKQAKDDKLFNISPRRWAQILSIASLKALSKHVNPHLLRHSCATWLRANGWALDEIKQYLGHENIATTNPYAQIDDTILKEKYLAIGKV